MPHDCSCDLEGRPARRGRRADRTALHLGGELSIDQASTAALLEALQAIGGTGPDSEHTLRRHLNAGQIQTLRTTALSPPVCGTPGTTTHPRCPGSLPL
ncbi:hypothetical protein GCM10027176_70890 [Actinoallomurus bryophytorum]|uniref:hypothetical protein n=1 Tax=Actinoallomurus bryophytorum TaxID=1490222 RepID=UPI00114D925B|nr:hypothetical protein [Actinoallomurus bryophytorum]